MPRRYVVTQNGSGPKTIFNDRRQWVRTTARRKFALLGRWRAGVPVGKQVEIVEFPEHSKLSPPGCVIKVIGVPSPPPSGVRSSQQEAEVMIVCLFQTDTVVVADQPHRKYTTARKI